MKAFNMTNFSLSQFTKAKTFAHFEETWKICPYKGCKRAKTCTGGPRGSFRKLKGKTLCETKPLAKTLACKEPESLPLSNSDFLKD